jgi:hypothetical protein
MNVVTINMVVVTKNLVQIKILNFVIYGLNCATSFAKNRKILRNSHKYAHFWYPLSHLL